MQDAMISQSFLSAGGLAHERHGRGVPEREQRHAVRFPSWFIPLWKLPSRSADVFAATPVSALRVISLQRLFPRRDGVRPSERPGMHPRGSLGAGDLKLGGSGGGSFATAIIQMEHPSSWPRLGEVTAAEQTTVTLHSRASTLPARMGGRHTQIGSNARSRPTPKRPPLHPACKQAFAVHAVIDRTRCRVT